MKRLWWRYGVLLASAAMLFQTTTCTVDQTTMTNVVTPLVTQFITGVLSGAYCPPDQQTLTS